MTVLIFSFLAGVLTVAAPCVLPLLPVIVGGSIVRGSGEHAKHEWRRPLVICASLAVSVILFTLLLRATTALLGVPQWVWSGLSGLLVIAIGFYFAYPVLWERLTAKLNLSGRTGQLLSRSGQRKGVSGDILLGAALGPAFNSCSPTYALIVAAILPVSFIQGFTYLLAYAVGLAGTLLFVAYAGQSAARKLGWLADPHGKFRRAIGALFIIVGVTVVFGIDRQAQTFILDQGWYDPIAELERRFGL